MNPSGWQLALYIGAALLALFLLLRPRVEGGIYGFSREAEAVHVVMNLAMAVMVSTLWTSQTREVTQVVLIATAVLLAGHLFWLWYRRDAQKAAGAVYHFCGVAAMIYAVHIMPAVHMPASLSMAGQHMHDDLSWISVTLGLLFLLDGAATLVLVAVFPQTVVSMGLVGTTANAGRARIPTSTKTKELRLSAIPHVIMDFGMALMLF